LYISQSMQGKRFKNVEIYGFMVYEVLLCSYLIWALPQLVKDLFLLFKVIMTSKWYTEYLKPRACFILHCLTFKQSNIPYPRLTKSGIIYSTQITVKTHILLLLKNRILGKHQLKGKLKFKLRQFNTIIQSAKMDLKSNHLPFAGIFNQCLFSRLP
jgi:hypothetical protein